jgi:hypothetical protein
MPLLGQAAMLLTFDVVAEAVADHDDWHTHEHLPERLSIPGFLRASRWVTSPAGGYLILYEVDRLDTLTSPAYLERLNHPTPWTRRLMPHYRGMARGLCSVAGSVGAGIGRAGLLVKFTPASDAEATLIEWLVGDVMPQLPTQPGLGSAHLLCGAATAQMTAEQRIRGADAGVHLALFVTGYDGDALDRLAETALSAAEFERRGGTAVNATAYELAFTMTADEVRH